MKLYYITLTIFMLVFLATTFVMSRIVTKLNRLSSDIHYLREKVDNDIKARLLEATYKLLDQLDSNNPASRALGLHLRMKIQFIVDAYNEVKHHYKVYRNFKILTNSGFANALLGSGSADLSSRFQMYPDGFLDKIDPLNQHHYDEFKEAIQMDSLTPESDMLSVLKTNAVGMYSKNVSAIISLYKQYEREIGEEEDTGRTSRIRKNRNCKKINSVKRLVADGKLKQALDLLERNAPDEDLMDEVIQQKSILSSIMRSRRMGIEVGSDAINKIRESILEIQNQIASD